jgi:phage baseplate assembly protein W
MAVVVGQYFVADNSSLRVLSDYALGLSIPMQMGTNTFFQNYDSVAQLKSNVTLLLRTRQGERLNQPLFGTKLHRILFEPNDDEMNDKITEAIETAVRYWIPELTVSNIEIDQSNEMKDKNEVGVKISFTAKGINAGFDVDFSINNNS